jgi:hypothetical protein
MDWPGRSDLQAGGQQMTLEWTKIDPNNLPERQSGCALIYFGGIEFWGGSLEPERDLIERTHLAFWDNGVLREQNTAHDVFEQWSGRGMPTHFAMIDLVAPIAAQGEEQ